MMKTPFIQVIQIVFCRIYLQQTLWVIACGASLYGGNAGKQAAPVVLQLGFGNNLLQRAGLFPGAERFKTNYCL